MPADFGKILDTIEADNAKLDHNARRLQRALEKLDGRLNALRAGVRIEPYETGKSSPVIGYRRFADGWHITTIIEGVAGITSELPITEAPTEFQAQLIPHLSDLLEKVSGLIADRVKASQAPLKEAERLLEVLP